MKNNDNFVRIYPAVKPLSRRSADVASWLLAVKNLESCCILPIIAEDGDHDPNESPKSWCWNKVLVSISMSMYLCYIFKLFVVVPCTSSYL